MRGYSLFCVAALVILIGCSHRSGSPAAQSHDSDESSDHKHLPGAHGGTIVAIGQDNYHAEAVFEKGGVLKMFMLGQDESKVIDVDDQLLTAYVKCEDETESTAISLHSERQPGDAIGKTSLFVGSLPADMAGKSVQITIPSIMIGKERFRLSFSSAADHDASSQMPDKVASDEESQLYLLPGGKYTQADIEANGRMTASQKFAKFHAAHDLNPLPGDQLCPVTLTKANPKCTWIINGQEYEFCCPPCVDEFVRLAKEEPAMLQDPSGYVKR